MNTPLKPEATLKECGIIYDQLKKESFSEFGISKDTQADCVDWFSRLFDVVMILNKENELLKQDTSTHFASYMKVCNERDAARAEADELQKTLDGISFTL